MSFFKTTPSEAPLPPGSGVLSPCAEPLPPACLELSGVPICCTRYRIETVFSQLVDRFNAKKVWARDRWHLTNRWWRKVLAHTLAVFTAQQLGFESPL